MDAFLKLMTADTTIFGVIPKLGNRDSYCPMLCANDCIVNVSQIKHLDGRHQLPVAPQIGRG